MAVNFIGTMQQTELAGEIADRFNALLDKFGHPQRDRTHVMMDILATHLNGCPLDLPKLRDASESTLAHDMGGIAKHLDRTTGRLGDCFVPRTALPELPR